MFSHEMRNEKFNSKKDSIDFYIEASKHMLYKNELVKSQINVEDYEVFKNTINNFITSIDIERKLETSKDIANVQTQISNDSHVENRKYNPNDSTYDEFTYTVKALRNEGKLSSHEVLLTTANFEKTLTNLNSNFEFYLTSSNSRGARNWINEFEALAKRELSRGNMLGYKRNMERKEVAVKVLELLQ